MRPMLEFRFWEGQVESEAKGFLKKLEKTK